MLNFQIFKKNIRHFQIFKENSGIQKKKLAKTAKSEGPSLIFSAQAAHWKIRPSAIFRKTLVARAGSARTEARLRHTSSHDGMTELQPDIPPAGGWGVGIQDVHVSPTDPAE